MIKIIIFINEEIITKEPKGLIMKRTINVIIIKEYRQTFLVTSTEESIFILYTFRKSNNKCTFRKSNNKYTFLNVYI